MSQKMISTCEKLKIIKLLELKKPTLYTAKIVRLDHRNVISKYFLSKGKLSDESVWVAVLKQPELRSVVYGYGALVKFGSENSWNVAI